MVDKFQKRYLKHQAKKAKQLAYSYGEKTTLSFSNQEQSIFLKVVKERRSQRLFNRTPIEPEKLSKLAESIRLCPSSCNRQAICIKDITTRDDKELISGFIVGGVGWCHRADHIYLLFADSQAYKAGDEINYMPYLDAGAMIEHINLTATSLNIGVGYINPNIREQNRNYFMQRFGRTDLIFCGALALGYFDRRVKETPKRPVKEIWL